MRCYAWRPRCNYIVSSQGGTRLSVKVSISNKPRNGNPDTCKLEALVQQAAAQPGRNSSSCCTRKHRPATFDNITRTSTSREGCVSLSCKAAPEPPRTNSPLQRSLTSLGMLYLSSIKHAPFRARPCCQTQRQKRKLQWWKPSKSMPRQLANHTSACPTKRCQLKKLYHWSA